MDRTNYDFNRLGEVVQGYREIVGLSQREVAAAGGPSDTTLSQIEAKEWESTRPHGTFSKLDKGFGWPAGTAAKIASGSVGVPDLVTMTAPPSVLRPWDPADDSELDAQVDRVRARMAELEVVRAELATSIRVKDRELAMLRAEHDRLLTAQERRAARRANVDSPLVTLDELQAFTAQSAAAAEIVLPNGQPRPDFVFIQPSGEIVVVAVSYEPARVEDALYLVDHLTETMSAGGARVLGLVLVAEGRTEVELANALIRREPRRPVIIGAADEFELAAARDLGRRGTVERLRAEQDEATSNSQERPGTEEGV